MELGREAGERGGDQQKETVYWLLRMLRPIFIRVTRNVE